MFSRYFLWLLMLFCVAAQAVDLRDYLPNVQNVYRDQYGNLNARYTLDDNNATFTHLYQVYHSLNKSGKTMMWKKEYWVNEAWCTRTYAVLFKADDLSVTETGDWYAPSGCVPSTLFGYQDFNGGNAGLIWSPVNGLTERASVGEFNTLSQASAGADYGLNGYQAYSKAGIVEMLPAFTPAFGKNAQGAWCAGCGKTYTDVAHIVMYHGVKYNNMVKVRCPNAPIKAAGVYYQSFKDYNSYAIELWLDKTKGIIQESTPFIEDGTYWGISNCNGAIFSPGYTKYIAD